MNWRRLFHTIIMCLIISPMKRANYLRKHKIFNSVGNNCMVMFRKIPLYPELISLGNNVWIASNVSLITHDAIHHMMNYKLRKKEFAEYVGCIEIKNNVFIGANSVILPNVQIGSDTIIGANSLVNKNISGGVYAGTPVRYICSIDEFISKRKHSNNRFEILSNGRLSEDTIMDAWERLHSKE